jgi:hypothetical protein
MAEMIMAQELAKHDQLQPTHDDEIDDFKPEDA